MDTIYVLDGSAFLYRSYYALPSLKTEDGVETGAFYGFIRAIFSILKTKKPEYFAIAFDLPAPTVRDKIYKEYKATRKETPNELVSQIPLIKRAINLLGIRLLEKEGLEADDIIAYIAHKSKEWNKNLTIYTPDKDLMQLVEDKKIIVINPITNKVFDEQAVIEKFGVPPSRLADYLALIGDSVDNIKGIKGVGPKKAVELLEKYGSIENILNNWDEIQKTFKEASKEDLELAYKLIKLNTEEILNMIDIHLEDLKISYNIDLKKVEEFFLAFNMKSLIKDLNTIFKEKSSGKRTQKTLF
ncbi:MULTISPECIES: 5'-3' exonuclease H3TH domain-containing protein [unclassified Hydrogenobaculum]|uniref:5'-3' exonuclease n=1 Tax=unclassified Hydrogenobaculum TaxID=2622382 RepID=UPI0001C52A9E|nr:MULTISPECIES: 5'-3' exonuclease H3TH domain-containing protein [unclassified Hydrogenobaculum]AEF18447.1 5'-3' exonuclease, resolvase-like domain-containing protein [Hydrogenobaculum sp. 3684]AEG45737.1 5'-3' exonuclease, resolvase-like domain-containing protein [Hydrogenobaculum sp. SHO]AGG14379.1 5'-3' exonuclease, N-terminal resolvase-like domain containing protein [Hydrogenobaculum sp. HO]AGH92683.1 5'-3' exonuclease (including N-terminal domain of PolI) [Hydrogenobaculum sp. SN]